MSPGKGPVLCLGWMWCVCLCVRPVNASHTRHARNVTRGGRTLVALIGQIRGGELAERSLIQHVLRPNQADLVLMVPKTASLLNSSLAARARYVWTLREPENWKQPIAAIAQALGAHRWLDLANVSGAVAFLGPARLRRGVRSPSTAAPNLVYRHLLKRYLVQHRLIEQYTRSSSPARTTSTGAIMM